MPFRHFHDPDNVIKADASTKKWTIGQVVAGLVEADQ